MKLTLYPIKGRKYVTKKEPHHIIEIVDSSNLELIKFKSLTTEWKFCEIVTFNMSFRELDS